MDLPVEADILDDFGDVVGANEVVDARAGSFGPIVRVADVRVRVVGREFVAEHLVVDVPAELRLVASLVWADGSVCKRLPRSAAQSLVEVREEDRRDTGRDVVHGGEHPGPESLASMAPSSMLSRSVGAWWEVGSDEAQA